MEKTKHYVYVHCTFLCLIWNYIKMVLCSFHVWIASPLQTKANIKEHSSPSSNFCFLLSKVNNYYHACPPPHYSLPIVYCRDLVWITILSVTTALSQTFHFHTFSFALSLSQGSCLNYNLERYDCFIANIEPGGAGVGGHLPKENRKAFFLFCVHSADYNCVCV